MDECFQRVRKTFQFTQGNAEHYKQMILKWKEDNPKNRYLKNADHLINDKFPQYWQIRYAMTYARWKDGRIRRIWRERSTGHFVTWNISPKDIAQLVDAQMITLGVNRLTGEMKPVPRKTRQERLMRPSGLRRY